MGGGQSAPQAGAKPAAAKEPAAKTPVTTASPAPKISKSKRKKSTVDGDKAKKPHPPTEPKPDRPASRADVAATTPKARAAADTNAASNAQQQQQQQQARQAAHQKQFFKQLLKQALEMAKVQRKKVGKFRKDERHLTMQLYDTLGLDDDEFLKPPNELQVALSEFHFPPPRMSSLLGPDPIDTDMMELVLGKAEATRRLENHEITASPREKEQFKEGVVRRAGVSGEATNTIKEMTVFKVVKKSVEQKEKLKNAMQRIALFRGMDPKDLDTIFDAFKLESFAENETIFEQGDDGDKFYLLDRGRCQITIKDSDGHVVTRVFIGEGETFGELGVMYGTPRAATVTATVAADVWSIDRDTYRGTILTATLRKRQRYMRFLQDIPILAAINTYEKAKIADVLEILEVDAGTRIVTQGDAGNTFYLIEEGEVSVVTNEQGEVATLGVSQFFGELALLLDQPRNATCTAKTRTRLVTLERQTFQNYLGPLESILKRNADQYDTYIKQARGIRHGNDD